MKLFPPLRQMAMEHSRFFLESTAHGGKQFLFVFDRLPKELHEELYRYINMELCYEDVYLNCSILKKGTPQHFDEVTTPERIALLNLRVDWDHLVLIVQAAPDYPMEKLTDALADACKLEGWTFSDHTKKSSRTK